MIGSLPYSFDILRNIDRDRYISVLFAPKKKRKALAALYAFNAEISRIRESVHDPFIGEIRLRWWYDSIAHGEMQTSGNNPILSDLWAAMTLFNLPKTAFLRYCDAQILDLYHNPIETLHDLEYYCGETASIILQLSCQVLDPDAAQDFTDIYEHGGIAQGLSGVLRLLSFMQSRYHYYLPTDMLKAVGVNRKDLDSHHLSDQQKGHIVEAMVALSRDHYSKFYAYSHALPRALKPAFLPLVIIPASLQKALQLRSAIFQESATLPLIHRYWLITRAAISGNFPKIL
ncbi:phytoene/squalene synthase family protein [Bartonella tribocorum]|uniref:Phytoene synthase n=1 Tax=Bartonella tribocorum (strain DSM 28219 / CCUG 45778 / CIP 105476 / IBS 506) TaxID=382640 RepID=A9IS32_BART1|nr:phytoene/squalene synthase family protein [Bartonella tribocorum]CAK01256.1 phytoene synthase [Bartonella tribocorum CIP 105476]CDO48477.1 phytoene synthase [Bartonella tribocorum]